MLSQAKVLGHVLSLWGVASDKDKMKKVKVITAFKPWQFYSLRDIMIASLSLLLPAILKINFQWKSGMQGERTHFRLFMDSLLMRMLCCNFQIFGMQKRQSQKLTQSWEMDSILA